VIGGVHHVAYVVADLDAAVATLGARFGMTPEVREVMHAQGVEAVMLRAGDGRVELITPLEPDGAIARFLASRGEGLHHVAYGVPDIGAALERLRADGAELIDAEPRHGLGGHLVAFVHPRSGLGVLTELVEDHGAQEGPAVGPV
jgi:methylmalonyl-CoA/ethylmalonyl-CoA epimerase